MKKKDNFHDYYAFICHRSADKELALKIQRKLEKYRIPEKIRQENHYPSRNIRHICVDVTEFKNNNLHGEIQDCLNKSDKLIVICSEQSASPVDGSGLWENVEQIDWRLDPVATGWVGFEILTFINTERAKQNLEPFTSLGEIRKYLDDHAEELNNQEYRTGHPELNPFQNVIPVVKGKYDPQRNCFHPLIQLAVERGLLKWYETKNWWGFKIKNPLHDRQGNFIDLVLSVLSPVNTDEFRRRDKRSRLFRLCLQVSAICLIIVGAALFFDYRMPHVSRYSNYVLMNELPQGIGKLSAAQAEKQMDYYVITETKYNKTLKLEHVNSFGIPIEDSFGNHVDPYESPVVAVYKLRANGQLDVCEYQDRNGIPQMAFSYTTDLGKVSFQENDFVSNQVYPISDLNEYGIPNRMKIDRYDLVHDEKGLLIKKMYMSGVNYVCDDQGVAGEQYDYDEKERLVYVHYLGPSGEYINNKNGIHGIEYYYDDQGNIAGSACFNKEGEKVYCPGGFSETSITKDSDSITTKYFDAEGNAAVIGNGYAVEVIELNRDQSVEEVSYFGRDSSPAYCADGYHKASYTYNKNGDIVEISLLNDEGLLMIGEDGYARKTMDVDDHGNILQEKFFGSDNKEIVLENEACTIQREYSSDGFLISEYYYGAGEKPVYTTDGYFGFVNEYDEKNRLICTRYMGLEGKAAYTRDGYHKIVFEYDDHGNMTRIGLYDASDRLVPYSGYWAEQILTYNGGGLVTRREYRNQFGKQVNIAGGYSVIENEYSDNGLLLQTSYYDNQGNLCDDCYMNSFGVLVGSRYYARISFTYDDFGNVAGIECFDTDDKPVSNYAYSSQQNEYDESGRLIRSVFSDANGNAPENYYSEMKYEYNENGRIMERDYSWESLESATAKISKGTMSIIYERDAKGQILSCTTIYQGKYQTDKVCYTYDDNGRELSEEYFDADNNRTDEKNGYAIKMYEYDTQGNITREAYYDADERLCIYNSGYAVRTVEYGEDGTVQDVCYYDENENRVNCSAGYSRIYDELNEYRDTVSCEFMDEDDTVLLSYKAEYNDNAQITEERLYGPDGNLYPHPEYGVAIRKLEYDDKGNKTGEKYYGEDGLPILVYGEYAGWRSEYDEKSLEVSRTYIGTDSEPITTLDGFAGVEFIYDEYGREIERIFYDEDGNKVNTRFGFASYQIEYDDAGNIQSYTFYDQNGTACDAEGEVKMVELNLHNGEVDLSGTIYNPVTGEWENGVSANTIYNVYRIAYQGTDGDYDQMLQPYFPLSPAYTINEYIQDIKARYP